MGEVIKKGKTADQEGQLTSVSNGKGLASVLAGARRAWVVQLHEQQRREHDIVKIRIVESLFLNLHLDVDTHPRVDERVTATGVKVELAGVNKSHADKLCAGGQPVARDGDGLVPVQLTLNVCPGVP